MTSPDSSETFTAPTAPALPSAGPLLFPAFSRQSDTSSTLDASVLPFLGVRSPGEIIGLSQGSYLRDPNVEGQYQQLNFRGIDWRGVSFTVDGRLMNDPASGVYNPYHFPTDYIERLEIIPGPRSFLFGLNGAGGAVNVVTRQFDSFRPNSKINYFEGSHGSGYFDGGISQNVSNRINATIGLQSRSTDGRYANSASEAWNSRARIRYRLGDRSFLLLSHYLTSTKTQLNGGIAPDPTSVANAFFPLSTDVRNLDSYEKITRNDVDLSFVGFFFNDSASSSRLTLYYSNNLREYRDENAGTPPNALFIQSDHRSSWMGAVLTQRFEQSFHRFTINANLELRQIEGSPNLGRRRNTIGSISALEEIFPVDFVTVAGYARYDRYLNTDYIGFGADARLFLGGGLSLFGGGSFSQRFPNYQELYWTDSTVSRSGTLQQEEHTQTEIGIEFTNEEWISVRLAAFHRRVVHPILFLPFGTDFVFPGVAMTNGADLVNRGFDFRFWLRVWFLYVEGTGLYLSRSSDSPVTAEYPEFSATGGLYFWEHLFGNHLNLKTGFRARVQTGQTGTAFNPEILAYVQNADQPLSAGAGVDFVLIGRIGDAHIHLIWENIIESQYFATPYYPVSDRAIRFGLSWTFLD